jgi:DNA polymerase III delta prime subunit
MNIFINNKEINNKKIDEINKKVSKEKKIKNKEITKNIPWVEKYRPSDLNDIVLETYNRDILNSIVTTGIFPNILFYGPPGTGKTTTIINLIKKFQESQNQYGKDMIIHLNASDDRGIDIIRNHIYTFVNSYNLFGKGLKFVILDEVDYMTKTAQQALKSLISQNNPNIKYCLICNYISKIERSLQEEFITFRFNQLPKESIILFLDSIVKKENLKITRQNIENIQSYFGSDIRSMINYIQVNHDNIKNIKLIDNDVFKMITLKLKEIQSINLDNKINNKPKKILTKQDLLYKYFYELSNTYNIEIKELFKKYIYYYYYNELNKDIKKTIIFLKKIEYLIHSGCDDKLYMNFLIYSLN